MEDQGARSCGAPRRECSRSSRGWSGALGRGVSFDASGHSFGRIGRKRAAVCAESRSAGIGRCGQQRDSRGNQADHAPAGPGVFVLTDSDLTTYYYVEVCQTLRIAVANLMRGGNRRGADSIKPRLAEHLGIPEARVAKYLADHCVVRWLQLDEGASNFAHFAIAVLRPILNE